MKDIIPQSQNISKQYRLGQGKPGTLTHDLNRWWHQIRGKRIFKKIGDSNDRATKGTRLCMGATRYYLEVERGEVLGIIGTEREVTLLKILSKVTDSTTSIKSRGRIASLLEVGNRI
jgi:lipopolysaccharide transport system ATP-binding protein